MAESPKSRQQQRAEREARERLKIYNARQAVHDRQVRRNRRDNVLAVVGVVLVATLATVTQIFYFSAGPGSSSADSSASASASAEANVGDVPDSSLAEARTWTGTLELNDVTLAVSLDGAAAPQAVSSIIQDVQDDYFTDKTCHRLVEDSTTGSAELIQCGSLAGDGEADPDYQFGPVENAPSDSVYPAGTIAMARGSSEYSMDHQFFITFEDATLTSDDGAGYTVIGQVTSGLDELIASDIVTAGTADGSDDGEPATATTITTFTLE
ncbi:MAG: peptidylprolyl isomerase [Microbacteriaceae bacterium]